MLTEDQMVKLLEEAKITGNLKGARNVCVANALIDQFHKALLKCPHFADQAIQDILRSNLGVYLVATMLAEALPRIPGQEDDHRLDLLCLELRRVGEQYRAIAIAEDILHKIPTQSVGGMEDE
jgi:hypothetical protein